MLLECLALLNDVQLFLIQSWAQTKNALRDWLGPGARNWYLTSDCQIAHIPVPGSLVFCPVLNRITKMDQTSTEAKTKRLPWLAICAKNGEVTWDFSDWLSDIRITTECPIPSLLQIVRLAARINHVHVFESEQTKIHLTNRDGEDEIYTFKGSIQLEKV